MIDYKAISQEALLDQLSQLVKNQENSWESFFEGSSGQIILEVLAAALADKNFNNLMRIRESSLDTAILESSIIKLAINKGIYRPSTNSLELTLSFVSLEDGAVTKNELIGFYKNYNIYSLEDKQFLKNTQNTLNVCIGLLEEFSYIVDKNIDYYEIKDLSKNKYLSNSIESLFVNGEELELLNERKSLYYENLSNTVLKIIDYYGFELIFGDGTLGKKVNLNDKVEFKVLTFNDDLFNKFDQSQLKFIESTLFSQLSIEVNKFPQKYIDKELIRKIALRTSIDGRWVNAKDYEDGIMYSFYSILDDVWVEDLYPSENVWILPKNDFLSDENKNEILDLIEKRKSTSALLNINIIDSSYGKKFKFFLTYVGSDTDDVIQNVINIVKNYFERKIIKTDTFFNSSDFAVEVTKLLPNGKMYASSLDENLELKKGEYLKQLDVFYIKKG